MSSTKHMEIVLKYPSKWSKEGVKLPTDEVESYFLVQIYFP